MKPLTRYFSLFIILLLSFSGFGQSVSTKYSDEAEKLFDAGKYNVTIKFCKSKISKLLQQTKIDSLSISNLYSYIGTAQYKTRNFKKSIKNQNAGLTYCNSSETGKFIKAKLLYWKSFPEYYLNKPYKSYYSKKEALKVIKTMDNPDLEYLVGIYGELSLDASFMGYYKTALQFIEKAIQTNTIKHQKELQNKNYVPKKDLRLWLLYRYAQIITKKIYFEYNQADLKTIKSIIKDIHKLKKDSVMVWNAKDNIMTGAIYNFYGDAYLAKKPKPTLQQIDSASYYLNIASKYLTQKGNIYHYSLLQYNFSKIHKLQNEHEKALQIINELIALKKNKDVTFLSSYISEKVELLLQLNKTDEAQSLVYNLIKSIHSSAKLLKKDFSNFEPSASISQTHDILSVAESIEQMDKLNPLFENQKNTLFKLALNQLKNSYKTTLFNTKLNTFYKRILKGRFKGLKSKSDFMAIKNILNDTENIENRLAWQQFNQSRNVVQLPIIDSLEQIEFNLRKQLITAKNERNTKKTDSLNLKLNQHQNQLKVKYPKLAKFTQNNFKITTFQKQIGKNEIVLKYIFFNDEFAVFQITRDTIQWQLNPWSKNEKALLSNHINTIKNPALPVYFNNTLTNTLIPKKALDYKKITIIPDTPIYQLPFETLPYNNTYLIKSKAVRYSSHLRLAYITKANSKTPSVGIFAPHYPKGNTKYVTRSVPYFLDGAQKEAKAIEKLFPSNSFIGKEATKPQFIANKSKGSLVHLAMHATININNPEFSHFNFPNKKKLYLEELYALKIPADLAVLSACNTAVGKVEMASGMSSLQRAFNFAGTKATVASLWEVPDKTTSEIMISFYKYLSKGKTKSEALQLAKQNYLNTTNQTVLIHPYYWAGFVLFGDDTPITTNKIHWLWYLVLVFFIFATGHYILKRVN